MSRAAFLASSKIGCGAFSLQSLWLKNREAGHNSDKEKNDAYATRLAVAGLGFHLDDIGLNWRILELQVHDLYTCGMSRKDYAVKHLSG